MRWPILAVLIAACTGGATEPIAVEDTDPTDTDTDTYVAPPPDLEIDVPYEWDFYHAAGVTYCPQFIGTMRFTNHTAEAGSFEANCPDLLGFRPISFAREQTTDYQTNLQLAIPPQSLLTVNVVFNCTLMGNFDHVFTVRASAGDVAWEVTFPITSDIPTNPGG